MNIDKFKQDHLTILGNATELRRLIQAGIAGNAEAIAKMIVSMSANIKMHLASEDRVLYPGLTGSSNTTAAQMAKKFQAEMGAIAAAYGDFSRKWNIGSKVAAEPDEFRKAADQILKALHERIQREDRDLYPLAERV